MAWEDTDNRQYVDLSEQDTTHWKVFNEKFLVSVRAMDLMDIEDVKEYGYITSGDDEIDRTSAREKIMVMLTIPEMLKLYSNHVNFYLQQSTDDKRLYDIICDHIREWREYAEVSRGYSYRAANVPYQDLVDLGEMASALYTIRDKTKDIDEELRVLESMFVNRKWNVFAAFEKVQEEEKLQDTETEDKAAPHQEDLSTITGIFNRRRGR
nr:MAG TPA: hypothetical protein [Caudoviricetes sp.]